MVKAVELNLSVEPERNRQTPQNDFSSCLRRGTSAAVQAVAQTAKAASAFVPGGAFVSAVAGAAESVAGAVSTEGGGQWALLEAQQKLQQEGLSNSLRLLELQRQMQKESEAVNTISNVMKSRHEAAKNTINNIR